MRKLSISVVVAIIGMFFYAKGDAEVGDFTDEGWLSTTPNLGNLEEWLEYCHGLSWECDWAWKDPLVMAQMLGGPGFDGVGSYITSPSELPGECMHVSILVHDTGLTVSGEDCNGNFVPDGPGEQLLVSRLQELMDAGIISLYPGWHYSDGSDQQADTNSGN